MVWVDLMKEWYMELPRNMNQDFNSSQVSPSIPNFRNMVWVLNRDWEFHQIAMYPRKLVDPSGSISVTFSLAWRDPSIK